MSSYRSGPGQSGTDMLALNCPPRAGEDRGQIGTGARSACLICGVRGAQPRRGGPPWRNGEGENTTRCRGNGGLGTCSHLFLYYLSQHARSITVPPPPHFVSQTVPNSLLPSVTLGHTTLTNHQCCHHHCHHNHHHIFFKSARPTATHNHCLQAGALFPPGFGS